MNIPSRFMNLFLQAARLLSTSVASKLWSEKEAIEQEFARVP